MEKVRTKTHNEQINFKKYFTNKTADYIGGKQDFGFNIMN